ncbi:Uncharacterised protein [Tsukamurella paurometabola]|uniref:Uncharacterized protein n=1 Tax=Tsukamurella paurometabola TaxID=2061 RepID=A0A3P8MBV7_TSUPA|nr:Uncharacterised protein [Tsukamurella paurometabola]
MTGPGGHGAEPTRDARSRCGRQGRVVSICRGLRRRLRFTWNTSTRWGRGEAPTRSITECRQVHRACRSVTAEHRQVVPWRSTGTCTPLHGVSGAAVGCRRCLPRRVDVHRIPTVTHAVGRPIAASLAVIDWAGIGQRPPGSRSATPVRCHRSAARMRSGKTSRSPLATAAGRRRAPGSTSVAGEPLPRVANRILGPRRGSAPERRPVSAARRCGVWIDPYHPSLPEHRAHRTRHSHRLAGCMRVDKLPVEAGQAIAARPHRRAPRPVLALSHVPALLVHRGGGAPTSPPRGST